MEEEKKECCEKSEEEFEKEIEKKLEAKFESCGKNKNASTNAGGGIVYCLGIIGAAIYYISTATGFWIGVLGFLKALVWPVFLVYGVLKFLG